MSESASMHPKGPRRRRQFDDVVEVKSINGAMTVARQSQGTLVPVRRGRLRAIVFSCPCGCAELLVINLDRRTGKAWKLYARAGRVTLSPSVWRTTGCKSHFFVIANRVVWAMPRRSRKLKELSGGQRVKEPDWSDQLLGRQKEPVSDWPFQAPPEAKVVTTRGVLDDGMAIILVRRDGVDGGWSFQCASIGDRESEREVGLGEILAMDSSLALLGDLPLGWLAWRADRASPWERIPPADDES